MHGRQQEQRPQTNWLAILFIKSSPSTGYNKCGGNVFFMAYSLNFHLPYDNEKMGATEIMQW